MPTDPLSTIAAWIMALCMIADQIRKFKTRRTRITQTPDTASPDTYQKPTWPRRLADYSCSFAVVAAVVLLVATGGFLWPSLCALYNFIVQYVLFVTSQRPANRSEIASLVFAAALSATIPIFALTGVLFKTQGQIINAESDMTKLQGATVSILKKLLVLPTPTPSPSPSPSP